MSLPPIRLGTLARVLDRTGRIALRDGVELRSLSLIVPVSEPPVLDPVRLWRIPVARQPKHWWQRWFVVVAGKLGLNHASDWPQVRLVWEGGAVFAELDVDPPLPIA